MKNRLTISCIMYILCMAAIAQTAKLDYRLFAEDGKQWEIQVGGIMENIYGSQINGDTIINGESWKKVYNYVIFPEVRYSYYASIRDVDNKVYAIAKDSTKPRLLYDFGLKEGDMVKCGVESNVFCCLLDQGEQPDSLLGIPFIAYLHVLKIDTIEVRGLQYRYFTLALLDRFKEYYRNGDDPLITVWVEGVGSGAGPFSPWMPLPSRNSILQSCMNEKKEIFAFPDFYEFNGTNSIRNIRPTSYTPVDYFDLQGRRLAAPPTKGVYIQNGRKYVVK